MSEVSQILRALDVAGSVGGTAVLVVIVIYFFTGRIPTPREYNTAVALAEFWQKRSDEKEAESADAHEEIRQMSRYMPELIELIDSTHRRLDNLGVPKDHQRAPVWRRLFR